MLSTVGTENRDVRVFQKDLLDVKVYPTTVQMGAASAADTADKICELLERKEEINMIFAAAPSQSEFLKCLVSDSRVDFSRINAFHMDEYIGIGFEHPQSFGRFLHNNVFGKVPFKSVHYINGMAEDLDGECERYSRLLEEYPVDIVCLGIGENGHIAFNDPDFADFNDSKMVKVIELDPVCRQQQVNEKCFDTIDDVPKKAITLTIPTLLKAEWMYCIVPFSNKAKAVKRTLEGDISEECPATILRKKEKSCLYLNYESASLL